MNNLLTNTYPLINLHKKRSLKSEIVTQMIYGDSFKILEKKNKWFKIKILEDNYKGFIKEKKFFKFIKPSHKVFNLYSIIYKHPNKKQKVSKLSFGSKVKITQIKGKYGKIQNGWISLNSIKPIKYKEKDIFKRIDIFANTKYKWGGKTFKGIDCSALVQVFFNFNNKFLPRDTGDQIKYLKKDMSIKRIKKNDILFWKGHVAIAKSKKNLIHAYGPRKKVIFGDTIKTINLIKKTAKLKLLKIKRI